MRNGEKGAPEALENMLQECPCSVSFNKNESKPNEAKSLEKYFASEVAVPGGFVYAVRRRRASACRSRVAPAELPRVAHRIASRERHDQAAPAER